MKMRLIEPAYEPLRTWALHPCSVRPPGLAHLLRGGIITWLRETHPLPPPVSRSSETNTTHLFSTPLSTIVAAMIAEVCQ
jgi:hypothetical protein